MDASAARGAVTLALFERRIRAPGGHGGGAARRGRAFDASLLTDLPATVDRCGENGEFHSFACAGPMFHHPRPIRVGEIVDRDGFVFADVLPR